MLGGSALLMLLISDMPNAFPLPCNLHLVSTASWKSLGGGSERLNPLGQTSCQQLDKCSNVWTCVTLLLLLFLWSTVDTTVTAFTWDCRKQNYCLPQSDSHRTTEVHFKTRVRLKSQLENINEDDLTLYFITLVSIWLLFFCFCVTQIDTLKRFRSLPSVKEE